MENATHRRSGQEVLLQGGPLDGSSHLTLSSPDVLAMTRPLLVIDRDTLKPITNRDHLAKGIEYLVYRIELTEAAPRFLFTDLKTRAEIDRFEAMTAHRIAAPAYYLLAMLPVPIYMYFLSTQPLGGFMGVSPNMPWYFAGWVAAVCFGTGIAWFAHRCRPIPGLAWAITIFNVALGPILLTLGLFAHRP